jgi:hypothetical protein
MEDLQTGTESESVSRKLREGIIKGRTALKVLRTLSQGTVRPLRIGGRLFREHAFKTRILLLQHNDEELLKMSEDGFLPHRGLTVGARKMCAIKRQGLRQICLIGHVTPTILAQLDRSVHRVQDVQTRSRNRFQVSQKDG